MFSRFETRRVPDYRVATDTSSPSVRKEEPRTALLSIANRDRIYFIRFPESTTTAVSDCIQRSWPRGIQKIRPFDGDNVEIQLNANPFSSVNNRRDKVAARLVILDVLDVLARWGWCALPGAIGLGRPMASSGYQWPDYVAFRKTEPQTYSWLCVTLDASDLLRFINAPPELVTAVIDRFSAMVESSNQDPVSRNVELKFKDKPWPKDSIWSLKTGQIIVRSMLIVLDLAECLEDQGYTFSCTLDLDAVSGSTPYQRTWFCYR